VKELFLVSSSSEFVDGKAHIAAVVTLNFGTALCSSTADKVVTSSGYAIFCLSLNIITLKVFCEIDL